VLQGPGDDDNVRVHRTQERHTIMDTTPSSRKPRVFVVGVDGSEPSIAAFELARVHIEGSRDASLRLPGREPSAPQPMTVPA
jgi:hypothetical protein